MVVMIMAAGFGINAAVFSVVDRLLFRALPYKDPQRLVQIHLFATDASSKVPAALLPYEVSAVLDTHVRSIDGIAWDEGWVESPVVAAGQPPLVLTAVSAGSLTLAGVSPVIGRLFDAADAAPSSEYPVVLGYEAWRSRFGGRVSVLGETFGTARRRFRVVGILPREFFFPSSFFVDRRDGFIPSQRGALPTGYLTVAPFARLAPGATIETAQAEIASALQRQEWQGSWLRNAASTSRLRVMVQPLRSGLTIIVGPYLWLVTGGIWLLVGITAVNVATLLLTRAARRQVWTAIRAALGASPRQAIQTAIVEGAFLCMLGAASGWLLFSWLERWLLIAVPPTLRDFVAQPNDSRVLAVSFVLPVLVGIAVGAVPGIALRRLNIAGLLQSLPSRRHGGSRLMRAPLLAAQASFSVVVMCGTVATVPPVVGQLLEPPGFVSRDLYVVSVNHDWPHNGPKDSRRRERVSETLDAFKSLPNIAAVGAATIPPSSRTGPYGQFWTQRGVQGKQWYISDGGIAALQSRILAGREFQRSEVSSGAAVAMLTSSGAKVLWPRLSLHETLGKSFPVEGRAVELVGVVEDLRWQPGSPALPGLFLPIGHWTDVPIQSALSVMARLQPGSVPDVGQMTTLLNQRFPPAGLTVASVRDEQAQVTDRPRLLAMLFGVLGCLALTLTVVGVYAVADLDATEARYEIGVRLAIGASPSQVRWTLITRTCSPVVAGALLGCLTTMLMLKSWHVAQTAALGVDLSTQIVATVAVIGVSVLAAGIQCSRLSMSPVMLLRSDARQL